MGKWNEEGVPNLNLSSADLKKSKLVSKSEKNVNKGKTKDELMDNLQGGVLRGDNEFHVSKDISPRS
ncbi:hypothetical protein LGQ02_10330 [Bacillus shivajii]|uniref:hypothetical protein n=1 Tax=Bacillus shivajii TaxID=1983719 RepID=UPI001CFB2407|nr:hypothetical protein [Bacillus shivajii]UCZ55087.1 hypothetical protein LGQ02_10330 [Bacillus shivajii]